MTKRVHHPMILLDKIQILMIIRHTTSIILPQLRCTALHRSLPNKIIHCYYNLIKKYAKNIIASEANSITTATTISSNDANDHSPPSACSSLPTISEYTGSEQHLIVNCCQPLVDASPAQLFSLFFQLRDLVNDFFLLFRL